jgi:EAL domain-containing protein (putative c-di-GMP-specific phosphodiesterase class I)
MSPHLGFVGPDEFVAVAEQCNLTQDLAAMMANTAVRLLNDATSPRDRDATLSINLSTIDLCDDALVETLVNMLVANPSAAGRLYVELTERVDSMGMREMRQNLDRIKATGCRLALDDFGAGYSSLTWVEALPVDLLKIDRSLISRCTETRGRTMVEMVIATASTLGIPCVAEGVETEEEAQILTDLGAQRAQGYYFARPLAIDDWRAYPGTRRP